MSCQSHNVDDRSKQILNEILASLHDSDEPLEYHLPPEITRLDKAALLAVLYRLLMKV